MVAPYFPSLGWYTGLKSNDRLNRASLPGGVRLTVPIVGGASVIKHRAPETWHISEHGDWPLNHWHALETIFSRLPYFLHYSEEFRNLILNHTSTFGDLTQRINKQILSILNYDSFRNQQLSPSQLEYATELSTHFSPEVSILHPLMLIGPETIFLILGRLQSK